MPRCWWYPPSPGTSAAAPNAAAIAHLLKEVFTDRSNREILQALFDTARRMPSKGASQTRRECMDGYHVCVMGVYAEMQQRGSAGRGPFLPHVATASRPAMASSMRCWHLSCSPHKSPSKHHQKHHQKGHQKRPQKHQRIPEMETKM